MSDNSEVCKIVLERRGLAGGQFCVMKDPSGAVAGLYQP
jgi:hypothetical protein